jgi:hypothetical protein
MTPRASGHPAGAVVYRAPAELSNVLASPMSLVSYKGFAITARTFQLRGSGRWTLDLLIGRQGSLRAFSGAVTYSTEEAAIAGCWRFAQRIIDGQVRDCSVEDLS